MINMVDKFRQEFARKAIILEIGGFRPTNDPAASWFGKINLAAPGESWPHQDGKPMLPLAQINLTELPFRPHRLEDIDFITIFIGPENLPELEDQNGKNWVLRAYKNIQNLVPLEQPVISSHIKAFQMRPNVIEKDYPCHDDVPLEYIDHLSDAYYEQFENFSGFKLGGWPTLLQSEITWAPFDRHPIKPEYVFQIDTTEKGNWMWGDNGVGHYGRGTAAEHKDDWAIEWQCL